MKPVFEEWEYESEEVQVVKNPFVTQSLKTHFKFQLPNSCKETIKEVQERKKSKIFWCLELKRVQSQIEFKEYKNDKKPQPYLSLRGKSKPNFKKLFNNLLENPFDQSTIDSQRRSCFTSQINSSPWIPIWKSLVNLRPPTTVAFNRAINETKVRNLGITFKDKFQLWNEDLVGRLTG